LFPLETNNFAVLFVLLLSSDKFELSREAVHRFPIIKRLRIFLSKHRFFHSSSCASEWRPSFFFPPASFS